MMPWDVWCYFVLAGCVLGTLLWKVSEAFRYFAKMGLYYVVIGADGVLSLPFILLRPTNPDNYRVIRWLHVTLSSWVGMSWEVRGAEHLYSEAPYVLVSNHQSSLDLLGMMEILPDRCVALIKKSLLAVPCFGWPAWLAGSVFVERSNTEAAKASLARTLEFTRRHRLKLWVFPEGTRNHGEEGLLPFKKGAFHLAVQAQVPVVPLVYSSYKPFYSKPQRRFQLGGRVILEALAPVPTAGLTEADVGSLCDSVRSDMAATYARISQEAASSQPSHIKQKAI